MIHRTSYMEPPLGVAINKLPVSKRQPSVSGNGSFNTGGGKGSKTYKIKTYIYTNGKLYERESVRKAIEIINRTFSGKSFKHLRKSGYHQFNTGDFLFTDKEKLPQELKIKIESLEIQE